MDKKRILVVTKLTVTLLLINLIQLIIGALSNIANGV
jgi:hypothetical protein